MKSHQNAGQFNLRGKKSMALRCGCCDVADKREDHARQTAHRDLEAELSPANDYTPREFAGDICTDEALCWLCLRAKAARHSESEEPGYAGAATAGAA